MDKEKLEKIILKYTGAATAILGANAVQGQVVYTDIPDVTLDENGEFYDFNIDLDTAGVIDFRITQLVDSSNYMINGVVIQDIGTASNQVAGLDYGNYNYPFKLNLGDTIGNGQLTFKGLGQNNLGYLAFEVLDTTYPNSNFIGGVTDGFLGLRFRGDFNDTIRTYYGWIRLDVAADLRSVTIKDFAYQSQFDSLITAGEGAQIGLGENPKPQAEINQQGLDLWVRLPETYRSGGLLEIHNLSGQLIFEEKFTGREHHLPLNNLPKGVLVATLRVEEEEVSKKIVTY